VRPEQGIFHAGCFDGGDFVRVEASPPAARGLKDPGLLRALFDSVTLLTSCSKSFAGLATFPLMALSPKTALRFRVSHENVI
jgi:hypothetical protein